MGADTRFDTSVPSCWIGGQPNARPALDLRCPPVRLPGESSGPAMAPDRLSTGLRRHPSLGPPPALQSSSPPSAAHPEADVADGRGDCVSHQIEPTRADTQ